METINWRAQVDNHWCEQDEGGEREKTFKTKISWSNWSVITPKIAASKDVYLM